MEFEILSIKGEVHAFQFWIVNIFELQRVHWDHADVDIAKALLLQLV